jgi:hypothetical protein
MGQRANIKFCFKMDKTATESGLWSECSLSLVHGFLNGVQEFGMTTKISKMTNAMDDQQPFEHLTVRKLISTDHQMTLRMMEEELKINRETIHKIVVEDIGKRKTFTRFVPHCLIYEENVQTASLSRIYSIYG